MCVSSTQSLDCLSLQQILGCLSSKPFIMLLNTSVPFLLQKIEL